MDVRLPTAWMSEIQNTTHFRQKNKHFSFIPSGLLCIQVFCMSITLRFGPMVKG
jgi:hypothetical protein